MHEAPLVGRTFLVAASEDRTDRLVEALRAQGATAIPFPTVRLVPPADIAAMDRALLRWNTYDWIVFTSTHGVDAIVERARDLTVPLSRLQGRIAAVGPATKAALEAVGLPVHVVPDEFLTDAIPDALGDVCGKSILLPRSRIARKSLADELRSRGANVVEVDAYDAVPASPDLEPIRSKRRIDFVLFTSASAAQNFASLLPKDLLERVRSTAEAACIGPVAAEAARSLGFHVTVVAEEHTVPGLVESLSKVSAHE
ncbi:MAG: uroporphyrinogen-III synthase [Candidatus Thermoplasmatota archaeon]